MRSNLPSALCIYDIWIAVLHCPVIAPLAIVRHIGFKPWHEVYIHLYVIVFLHNRTRVGVLLIMRFLIWRYTIVLVASAPCQHTTHIE